MNLIILRTCPYYQSLFLSIIEGSHAHIHLHSHTSVLMSVEKFVSSSMLIVFLKQSHSIKDKNININKKCEELHNLLNMLRNLGYCWNLQMSKK